MFKKTSILLFNCLLILVLLSTSIYAWYTNYVGFKAHDDIQLSSNTGYFAGGNGTKDNPYLISSAVHLYNLAWLQDLGYFDDKIYYFELNNDVDMNQINNIVGYLPPIGINGSGMDDESKAYKFKGHFEGNQYKISNLKINTTKFDMYPSVINDINSFNFGDSVGVFGYTYGEYQNEALLENSSSTVQNVILENPTIVTAITTNSYVGVVAGQVEGKMSKIAVVKPNLSTPTNHSGDIISNNILVGNYNDNLTTDFPELSDSGAKVDLELDIDKIIAEGVLGNVYNDDGTNGTNGFSSSSLCPTSVGSGQEFFFYTGLDNNNQPIKMDLNGIRIFGSVELDKLNNGDDWDPGNVYDTENRRFEFRFSGGIKFKDQSISGGITFTTTGPGTITVNHNSNADGRKLGLYKYDDTQNEWTKLDDPSGYTGTVANKSTTISFEITDSGTYAFGSQSSGIDVTYFKFDYDDVVNGNVGGGSSDTSGSDLNYIDIVSSSDIDGSNLASIWTDWKRWQIQVKFISSQNQSINININKVIENDEIIYDLIISGNTNVTIYNPFNKNIRLNGIINTDQLITYET